MQERRDVLRPLQHFKPVRFPHHPRIIWTPTVLQKTSLPASFDIATKLRVAHPVGDPAFAIGWPTMCDTAHSSLPSGVGILTPLLG